MTVSLRIVGNFYHQDDIPYTEGMTVKDVLEYASHNPVQTSQLSASVFAYQEGTLTIGPAAGKPSINWFYAFYTKGFNSPTSGLPYPAGPYFLAEDLYSCPTETVWQYYVFTNKMQAGGAEYIPNEPRVSSFVDAKVPDGGFVVWRLVTILGGPNAAPSRKQGEINRALGDR